MHPSTTKLILTGKVWTIDSWDGERFSVTMSNSRGHVIATQEFQGNNFQNRADESLSCEGSVSGWQDGYYNIRLVTDYNQDMGDITVRIQNSLD